MYRFGRNESHLAPLSEHYGVFHNTAGPAARLREIIYGRKPEDWKLVWETYEDEWPGQFWMGVDTRIEREEALKSRPPGAWIDEEDSEEIEHNPWDHD